MTSVRTAAGRLGAAAAGVAALGAAAFGWGALIERNLYTLRRVTVPVLPPDAHPIRVLHISDLHMAPWQRRKQRWVSRLADLTPDLVVNTGDNLGHRAGVAGIAAALSRFSGVPGVYVWGSNDYFGPQLKNPLRYLFSSSREFSVTKPPTALDLAALQRDLDGLGWVNLNNRAAAMEVRGTRLEFFGVDDPHHGFDRLGRLPEVIEAMREQSDAGDDTATVTVGVVHAPYQRVLDSFVNHGADIIFAGHTHGGQVCVPGFGALITNCDLPREQVKGLSLWSHTRRVGWLHVSAGLGTAIYAPFRFACRPEATLLTLTAA